MGLMKHHQALIEQIRSFNRYYTNVIGLLDQNFLDSPFSLTEGRVLYEINHMEDCSAKKIRENITIDEGYLSRILDKFRRKGLITKSPSRLDGRLQLITITAKGRAEFLRMNDHSNQLISGVIKNLSVAEGEELVDKMERIRELLSREKTLNAEK
jgi:DNA-binding MarR family transcriptional regulator